MSGAIKARTPVYRFNLINFDFPSWGDIEHANWKITEAILGSVGATDVNGTWENSTAYIVGNRIVDVDTSTIYLCEVAHTSAATGLFAADRTANPSRWSAVSSLPVWRSTWATTTVYNTGDIVVVNTYDYYFCTVAHTSGATFVGDSANWQLIFQGSTTVTAAETAKTNAETAETNAAASASAASTSASNAAASASTASAQATNASNSASTASTQATNASNSASAASTSASNAATSETNAGNSATAAAGSASAASASATDAANSAIAAATFDPDNFVPKVGGDFTGPINVTSGNVGIGTSAPAVRLHLKAGASTFVSFSQENTNGGTDEKIADWINNGTNYTLRIVNDAFTDARNAYTVERSGYTPITHYWYTAASGASLERMRLDASGNVGIGTSSPLSKLHVEGAVRSSSAGASFTISGAGSLTTALGGGGAAVTSGTFVAIETAATERLRIDSAGRVTMPYQPFFMGRPTTDYGSGGMPTGVMDITMLRDNGNNFNSANSRFTAPVSGWYRTTWGGLQLPDTVTSLMINGTRTRSGNLAVLTGSYLTMTQTSIEYMIAGDYLNIEQWNGGGYLNDWYLWTVELIG